MNQKLLWKIFPIAMLAFGCGSDDQAGNGQGTGHTADELLKNQNAYASEVCSCLASDADEQRCDYLLRFMDLSAEVGSKVVPMFWGVSCGFELATGYPFGFFQGPGYDLEAEALDRFVKKTEKLRKHARGLGLELELELRKSEGPHPWQAAEKVN